MSTKNTGRATAFESQIETDAPRRRISLSNRLELVLKHPVSPSRAGAIKNNSSIKYPMDVLNHIYKNATRFYNLNFFQIDYIHSLGCARWGVSGALFPKSALCGAEFPLKGLNLEAYKSS